jgi:alpha-2-macroglobulin
MNALIGRDTEAAELLKEISKGLASETWHSTQTTAYALMAAARFIGHGMGSSAESQFKLKVNGKDADGKFTSALYQKEVSLKEAQANALTLVNQGKGILYARLLVKGKPAVGPSQATAEGIQLNIAYRDLQGNDLAPEALEQGTDFIADFTVQHMGARGDYKQLALASVFPSGWEIRNTRMDPAENTAKQKPRKGSSANTSDGAMAIPEYQDFRDDRVHTFFDLKKGHSKRFRFYLHAAYLGEFHLPTSLVEAMYDASIQSRSASGRVVVGLSEGSEGNPDAPSRLQGNQGDDSGASDDENSSDDSGDGQGDDSGEESSGE